MKASSESGLWPSCIGMASDWETVSADIGVLSFRAVRILLLGRPRVPCFAHYCTAKPRPFRRRSRFPVSLRESPRLRLQGKFHGEFTITLRWLHGRLVQ